MDKRRKLISPVYTVAIHKKSLNGMHAETLKRVAIAARAIATDLFAAENSRAWAKARLEAAEEILKERGLD